MLRMNSARSSKPTWRAGARSSKRKAFGPTVESAHASHALSIHSTCPRAEGRGSAPIGPTVATQQVGQLCPARPMLQPLDGAFELVEALRCQGQASELTKFQADLGLVIWFQAISSRAVARTSDLPPVIQRERDASRFQCRHR